MTIIDIDSIKIDDEAAAQSVAVASEPSKKAPPARTNSNTQALEPGLQALQLGLDVPPERTYTDREETGPLFPPLSIPTAKAFEIKRDLEQRAKSYSRDPQLGAIEDLVMRQNDFLAQLIDERIDKLKQDLLGPLSLGLLDGDLKYPAMPSSVQNDLPIKKDDDTASTTSSTPDKEAVKAQEDGQDPGSRSKKMPKIHISSNQEPDHHESSDTLKEQPKQSRMQRFVESQAFELGTSALVCINVLVKLLELEKSGYHAAVKLKLRKDDGFWGHTADVFEVIELAFTVSFTIELALRIAAGGCRIFRDKMICLDAALVSVSFIDLLFKYALSSSKGALNFSFARMARLLKLVKLLRAFKAASMFSELRVIFNTVATSVMSLTWSVAFLFFLIMFGAIIMAQFASGVIQDDSADYKLRTWVFERYGTGIRAMYTIFEATLSGGWPNYARRMIEEVSPAYVLFWIPYVIFVVFAVMRIISAMFLQKTMKMASQDEDMMLLQHAAEKEKQIAKIREFLTESDADGSGTLDQDELDEMLHHPDIKKRLHHVGIDRAEMEGLFEILAGADGFVSHDELIGGLMRLSGGTRAIDSILILHNQHDMQDKISSIKDILEGLSKAVSPKKAKPKI